MIHSSSSRLLAADAPRESRGGRIRNAFAVGRTRWGMLALVFFATTLNYIDRAALGVMQPILAEKMSWTAMDYANINFWFQVGYAIGFILQGRFIDKVGVKRAFFLAVLLWSLATGAHGLATSAAGFMVCRFILGLTEAANYPACVKTTRLWFPAGERAVATGIFNAGTNVGAMVTPALLPLILGVWGWQAAFLCMSALGLVWLVFWWRNYYNPEEHPRVKQSELEYIQQQEPPATRVPFSQILRRRGTWAFALAYSITAPVFWFYLYWLPPFLNQQYGLGISVTQMGIPLILIWLTADFGSVGGGILSSWLIGRGMPAIRARLLSMLLFACTIVGVVFAANASGLWIAVLAIALAIIGIGNGPAILALFLASLLPIVRNTYEGLRNVSPALKEAATGIGMTPNQVLLRVELPNAVPIIVGGVRVALALNVGSAPLAFLIGANSLGSLIFPGIYLNNHQQLLLGAACTALLALLLDALVVLFSRMFLERGLTAKEA